MKIWSPQNSFVLWLRLNTIPCWASGQQDGSYISFDDTRNDTNRKRHKSKRHSERLWNLLEKGHLLHSTLEGGVWGRSTGCIGAKANPWFCQYNAEHRTAKGICQEDVELCRRFYDVSSLGAFRYNARKYLLSMFMPAGTCRSETIRLKETYM